MVIGDTEEKILADLHNIVRRAIALGRRLEKDEVRSRIVEAIEADGGNDSQKVVPMPERAAEAPAPAPVERKQYPYGHVKQTVATALYQNQRGLSRAEVQAVCATQFDTEVSENGALTALKSLGKDGLAKFRESTKRWVPTHKLIEEKDKQSAPEPEAQGRLQVVA